MLIGDKNLSWIIDWHCLWGLVAVVLMVLPVFVFRTSRWKYVAILCVIGVALMAGLWALDWEAWDAGSLGVRSPHIDTAKRVLMLQMISERASIAFAVDIQPNEVRDKPMWAVVGWNRAVPSPWGNETYLTVFRGRDPRFPSKIFWSKYGFELLIQPHASFQRSNFAIAMPNWFAMLALGAMSAGFFRLHKRSKIRRLVREGKCHVCAYDLRAHKAGEKCPECGSAKVVANFSN